MLSRRGKSGKLVSWHRSLAQRLTADTIFWLDDTTPETYSYTLETSLSYSPRQAATLALIKHSPTLDTTLPLSNQLHFLNLFGPASSSNSAAAGGGTSGSGVYEGLHRLVHWGVAPAFEAFVESKGKKEGAVGRRGDDSKDADSKMGIPMTKKKFAELELSLLHCKYPG